VLLEVLLLLLLLLLTEGTAGEVGGSTATDELARCVVVTTGTL
jgi:hypothetical protein